MKKYGESLIFRIQKEMQDSTSERSNYLEELLLRKQLSTAKGSFRGQVRAEAIFEEPLGGFERKALFSSVNSTIKDLIEEVNSHPSESPVAMVEKALMENFSKSANKKVAKSTRARKANKTVNKSSKKKAPRSKTGKKRYQSRERAQESIATYGLLDKAPRVTTAEKFKRKRLERAVARGSIASTPMLLLTVINEQLPRTVAKNMGSPRLNYRTGRFASSTEATDVNITPKGYLSIGYTYMKYPYQTFEPGYKQGSVDRDPRKLIDLSIREIAVKFAIGRFYTRRV